MNYIELDNRVEYLESTVDDLEQEIAKLESRIDELEGENNNG